MKLYYIILDWNTSKIALKQVEVLRFVSQIFKDEVDKYLFFSSKKN